MTTIPSGDLPTGPERARWARARSGLGVSLAAVRTTAKDPAMVRVQLAWAAVMTASWAVTVAFTVTAYDVGGSAAVSIAVLARALPAAVASTAVGAVVDRVGRRRSLVLSALVSAAACAGAAMAGRLAAVVGLLTLVAVATMVFRTAQSVLMPEMVDEPADLTAANVLSSAIESLGVFVGPALAAGLIALDGPELALAAGAALFAVAGVLLIRLPDHARSGLLSTAAEQPRMRRLLSIGSARLLLGLVLCQTTVGGALVVLYPALAVETLEVDVGTVGLLTAAFGLGGVCCSVALFTLAGSSRLGLLNVVALVLWGLPLVVVETAPELALVLVLLALVGTGNALFDVTTVTLLQRAVPDHLLGRAFGALETAVVVGLATGALVAPALERLVGPSGSLAVLGGLLTLVAAASCRSMLRLDARLGAPTRQVELLRAMGPFALLPTMTLERLALRLQPVDLVPGEVAVRQGDPGDTYYLVEDGILSVTVDGRTVTELGVGDGFGEVALLHGGVRTATITAASPARIQALQGSDFLAALTGGTGKGLAASRRVAAERLRRAAPDEPPTT
ncbi:MAG TPA: MFS transporter [Nocardioides sp.]|nr:MFS transporter [Nocardioides sp.]